MVLDIEKYPEFVPWCIEGQVHEKNETADLIIFKGDLKVGKSILNETFSSHVSYYKEKDKIIVTNLDGPLKHLKNEWVFKKVNNATQLEFFIDFELALDALGELPNVNKGSPMAPQSDQEMLCVSKGAPWAAQHETEVPKVGSNRD